METTRVRRLAVPPARRQTRRRPAPRPLALANGRHSTPTRQKTWDGRGGEEAETAHTRRLCVPPRRPRPRPRPSPRRLALANGPATTPSDDHGGLNSPAAHARSPDTSWRGGGDGAHASSLRPSSSSSTSTSPCSPTSRPRQRTTFDAHGGLNSPAPQARRRATRWRGRGDGAHASSRRPSRASLS